MGNYIELCKKLKALSERGIGGEKINAQKMLDSLMKRHNISIEDIEGEKTQDYFLNVKNDQEEQLCQQIVKRVNRKIKTYNRLKQSDVKRFKLLGNYIIECTASEYVEIESMFSIYNRLYKSEIVIFFRAFCTANDLLVVVDESDKVNISSLDAEERQKLLRADFMAETIAKIIHRKQIK